MDESQRRQIAIEIMAGMRSFEDAERDLDPERVINHFAPVPDFHLYNDGQRVSYETMVAALRETLPALRSIQGGFEDVQVMVLGSEAALASARFSEVVTDATGSETRLRGAASWLWRRIDGRWCIVYGQTDHYPNSSA